MGPNSFPEHNDRLAYIAAKLNYDRRLTFRNQLGDMTALDRADIHQHVTL